MTPPLPAPFSAPHDDAAARAQIVARDRQVANPYAKDTQVTAIRGARAYRPDRITRVAAPHRILDPKAGPLIAVRLHILTRKSLGGLQTDLDSRVLTPAGERCRASTPRARWPASAAAACTAIARWRGRSSAVACSQVASRAAPQPPPPPDRTSVEWGPDPSLIP